MTSDFLRVCAARPSLKVAEIGYNSKEIADCIDSAGNEGASFVLFPELSLTGYTCADLFYQQSFLERAESSLWDLVSRTRDSSVISIVGIPLRSNDRLYNSAVVFGYGRILGCVPKQYLPNTREFYEQRWFSSGIDLSNREIKFGDQVVPFGDNLIFENPRSGFSFGVEVCEDLWTVEPPSSALSLAGASILFNLSASPETLGKSSYRRDLVSQQSARCNSAYVYSSSGVCESSTDLVYSGHCMIAENGILLSESNRFEFDRELIFSDIDLARLSHERLNNPSFYQTIVGDRFKRIEVSFDEMEFGDKTTLLRPNPPLPFVPDDPLARASSCFEIFNIQTSGLATRLRNSGIWKVVIGLSGGLDSTLALLVAVKTFEKLGIDPSGVNAVSMPGFGTTDRTLGNAERMANELKVSFQVIPINNAVASHFEDIGHDPEVHDVTFENSQARERTQILMDLSNRLGALVVGTGDLSESSLGWCTFNGDHMSMYHVNSGIPKTLVSYMVKWCADELLEGAASETLLDVLGTPITPELLPLDDHGRQSQETEEIIGPYELHDFFLYHMIRFGSGPAKIIFLAERAFEGLYEKEVLLKWLEVFVRRFFSQQFKRSSMPDGPKVGSVALSPRGDWRMPSDASPGVWLDEIESLRNESNQKVTTFKNTN
jgi:NAD+ synthase (glutamine-hydrolysing)